MAAGQVDAWCVECFVGAWFWKWEIVVCARFIIALVVGQWMKVVGWVSMDFLNLWALFQGIAFFRRFLVAVIVDIQLWVTTSINNIL